MQKNMKTLAGPSLNPWMHESILKLKKKSSTSSLVALFVKNVFVLLRTVLDSKLWVLVIFETSK